MNLIYLAIGIAVGALAVYLLQRGNSRAATALLESERQQHADTLASMKSDHATRLLEERDSAERRRKEEVEALERRHKEEVEALSKRREEELSQIRRDREAEMELWNKRREAELEQLRKGYETQLTLFKEQITTTTEKFLRERSGELQDANTKKMDELFKPLKDDLERMEKSMTDHRVQNAKTTATFEEHFRQMMESNDRLGREADRLSTALQKQNKVAGNWGELILSQLLESQGLQEGVHFDVQQTLRDASGRTILNEESGSRMIPDVVLHLADNRDVVVDSKMSLTAFVDYQNAETEEERAEALRRHIASVRAHVSELAAKSYSSYIQKPRTSIDFVIMFVPIEGALQLVLSGDATLWREAFDKKVFIVGGQTLMAAMHIIDLTWVNVLQERNTQKIMDEARKLIDRVSAFYKEYLEVGNKLEAAVKANNALKKRVDEGSQSILASGHRLESLGARGKKQLPKLADDTEEPPIIVIE